VRKNAHGSHRGAESYNPIHQTTVKSKKISNQKTGNAAARCNSRISSLWLASGLNRITHSAGRASGVILPMIAAVILLAAAPRVGRAQCSSAPALPSGCTWTPGSTTTTVPGGSGCQITVYYCSCCCNNIAYSYMYEIVPTGPPGPDCDTVNPENMIYAGAKAMRDIAAGNCTPPPCGMGADLSITTFVPTCWTESDPSGEYEITPCSQDTCYCAETCQVCLNNGVLQYSNCSTITHGSCACTANPWEPWLIGTCYMINCHNF
jgi:hypothetical protein